jgi:two-component system, LuxR family, sensor kinase FixL
MLSSTIKGLRSGLSKQDILAEVTSFSSPQTHQRNSIVQAGDRAVPHPITAALLTSLGYYLGARIGFSLTFEAHAVSTLWPPNSILLAALVLTPYRWWWFMLLTVLPAHLLVELRSGVPTPMVLSWFVSNCSEALIGASIIRRFSDAPTRIDSIRRVTVFFAAALLAPFLSSFLDAGFVVLNRWGVANYWQVWRMRFFSNVLAELTIVPLVVIWVSDGLEVFRRFSEARKLEVLALALALLSVGLIAFSGQLGISYTLPALLYAPLPLLLWAAVRFGPRGVNTSLVVVAFLTIWGAVHGRGPFSTRSPEENALSIQLFLILVSMPLMFLAAVIQELGRAREEARQKEDRLAMALNAAQMGTWDWHLVNDSTTWSAETKRMFGLQPDDSETSANTFYDLVHPDDREMIRREIARSIETDSPYEAEFRVAQPDGSLAWVRGKGKVLKDAAGKPIRMVGVNVNVTHQKEAETQLLESNRQVRRLAGRLINAQEAERRRLANELHDDLSQKVATLSIAISRLKRKLPLAPPDVVQHLTQLYDQTKDLNHDIRLLSHELHPSALEHLGLIQALSSYVAEFEVEEGIQTSFDARLENEDIPFEVSVCLYRIAIEALRNIAGHAQAKSVMVKLNETSQGVVLEVTDSGIGFDLEHAKRGSGLGLISAEERVHMLQGSFHLTSSPGRGTTMIVTIPRR